jgi:TolB-like protein/tetratricopeptide (TPR) repeat protein
MVTSAVIELPESDIRAALERVLTSDAFASSPRHRELLRYLVDNVIGGRIGALRETTLALDVFGRDVATYDSAADPIVRVEMTRLRTRLKQYYAGAGRDDPIVIAVPKGSYVPRFARRADEPVAPAVDLGPPTLDPSTVESPASAAAPAALASPPRRWLPRIAPAMLVAVVALAVAGWALWRTNEPRGPSTVAIIPYVAPAEDRALAQTGEIVSAFMNVALSRMPDVRVVATSSVADAMRRTHDALEAGRTLSADYVVTGTVDRTPSGIAIETRMIRTRDRTSVFERRTDASQERAVPEQASVASALVAKLSNQVPGTGIAEAFAMPADPVARERWITARLLMSRFTPHGAAEADTLFGEVVKREPTFAPAYAYRAIAVFWGAQAKDLSTRDVAPTVRALAEHAIALDPGQPTALVAMAAIATLVDFDFVRAEALYRQAIKLAPSVAGVHQGYAGGLLYTGRFDESIAEIRLARTLDPFNVSMRYYEAMILGYGRRFEEADTQCREALAVDATNPVVVMNCAQIATRGGAHARAAELVTLLRPEHASMAVIRVVVAHCVASAGDVAAADAIYAKTLAAGRVPDAWAYEEATLLLALGHRERALARLDDAFRTGQPTIVGIDPAWDEVRASRDFRALLERHAPQIAAVSERSLERRTATRLAGASSAGRS